jgi:hypothetical protein
MVPMLPDQTVVDEHDLLQICRRERGLGTHRLLIVSVVERLTDPGRWEVSS